MTDKEKQIRNTLAQLAHMKENLQPPTTPEEIEAQHLELLEAKTQLAQQESLIDDLLAKAKIAQEDAALLSKRKEELESKLSSLEQEYEELLDKTIQEEEQNGTAEEVSAFEDLKVNLMYGHLHEAPYLSMVADEAREPVQHQAGNAGEGGRGPQEPSQPKGRRDRSFAKVRSVSATVHFSAQSTNKSICSSVADNQKLTDELKSTIEALKAAQPTTTNGAADGSQSNEEVEKIRKTMAQQLSEFDAMKKKLMRELQNRCEKVRHMLMFIRAGACTHASPFRWLNLRSPWTRLASSTTTSCATATAGRSSRRWHSWSGTLSN